MASRYGQQPDSARYLHGSDGQNGNQYRYPIRPAAMIGSDGKADRRSIELKARIRVARALRHSSSQSRLLPARPTLASSDILQRRVEPSKNLQQPGWKPTTYGQSTMSTTERRASRQPKYRGTSWWKSVDGEDGNRNNPMNQQLTESADHVVDNFRFIDTDRKWTENEPQYVDENIKRYVRSCRRAKSFDEDSDNDDDNNIRYLNNSTNLLTNSESERQGNVQKRSNLDRNDANQRSVSNLKRLRSRWTTNSLFGCRSIEEQRAFEDLLPLDNDEDQSMEVDSDCEDGGKVYSKREKGEKVSHNFSNEFVEITNDLHNLSLREDHLKIRTDSKLADGTSFVRFPRGSLVTSTVKKDAAVENYSTGSSKIVFPDDHSNTAIRGTVANVCASVSHPESTFRLGTDRRRSELDEMDHSKLPSPEKLLLPVGSPTNALTSETPVNLCFIDPTLLKIWSIYLL